MDVHGVFQERCRLKLKFMLPYFYQPLIELSRGSGSFHIRQGAGRHGGHSDE